VDGAGLTRHQYAEIEVKNYKKALDFIEKRKTQKTSITHRDILEIHTLVSDHLLPKAKVGTLRKNPIYTFDQNDITVDEGPAVNILKHEIDDLLVWLKASNDIHPVIVAGILHYQFVSIHSLADGNGRTTRLLTSLYLGLRDYDMRSSLFLDSYYSVDKQAYYDALSLASNHKNRKTAILDTWLDYFVSGFLSSTKVLAIEVSALSVLAVGLDKTKITKSKSDILSYTKQFGSVSLTESMEILIGLSKRTVQRRLMKLVNDGYLKIEGNARSTKYIWNNK
jgi:Fic family protein